MLLALRGICLIPVEPRDRSDHLFLPTNVYTFVRCRKLMKLSPPLKLLLHPFRQGLDVDGLGQEGDVVFALQQV